MTPWLRNSFKVMAHIDIVHIPYKGAAPALTDLMGGQVELAFTNVLSSLPHVRSGRLRVLAVTSKARSRVLPQVPAIAESGLPDYEASVWYAILAPARTPASALTRLHSEFVKALLQPKVQERLASDGASVVGSTPDVLARTIEADTARWGKVIRQNGLSLETPR